MSLCREIASEISKVLDDKITLMHICGTHESAISRFGLRNLLPPHLTIVMGPGCPVCITPQAEIDAAIELSQRGAIIATYGDLLSVPGRSGSLASCGGQVKVVQGIQKAIQIAERTDKEVVFFSLGFETTAPTVAATLLSSSLPPNFSLLSCHRTIPPALRWLLEKGEGEIKGFLLPGHVCAVTGYEEYTHFPISQVVAGFEPEEILLGLLMLIRQIRAGISQVENAYPRVVSRTGNQRAVRMIEQVFSPSDVEWRGFPIIPGSGLELRSEFEEYDAQKRFEIEYDHLTEPSDCICEKILRGISQPHDCPLFSVICNPTTPVGPCMVSHEGACRIWYMYPSRIPTI